MANNHGVVGTTRVESQAGCWVGRIALGAIRKVNKDGAKQLRCWHGII